MSFDPTHCREDSPLLRHGRGTSNGGRCRGQVGRTGWCILTGVLLAALVGLFRRNSPETAGVKSGAPFWGIPGRRRHQHVCDFTNVTCDTMHRQCFIKPTEYEDCMRKITIDRNHMFQSISSLDLIFQQQYPFYYTAIDPAASSPKLHQAGFGYTIYTGEEHGQVDIHARLAEIQESALLVNGSTMATFWRVVEAFNALRDGHVTAIQGNIGSLSSDFFSGRYTLWVFPKRNWPSPKEKAGEMTMRTNFSYDGDELILDIAWYNRGRVESTRRVKKINGKSPIDFIFHLANSPMSSRIKRRSIGARINSLISVNFPSSANDGIFFRSGKKGWREQIAPSLIVPDSFLLEYHDGTEEMFYSRIILSSADYSEKEETFTAPFQEMLSIDITKIQQQANEPTCLHRNFMVGTGKMRNMLRSKARAKKQAVEERSVESRVAMSDSHHNKGSDILRQSCDFYKDGWFTCAYNCSHFPPPFDADYSLEAGYKVMDEYIVFKLDSFDAPPEIMVPLWRDLTKAAETADTDRLIIDISDNGGGEEAAGYTLAKLMYPEVSCDMFKNEYDMVYNEPMRIWSREVQPLLTHMEMKWFYGMSESDKSKIVRTFSREHYLKTMMEIVEAMCILSLDHKENYCGDLASMKTSCRLFSLAETFQRSPNATSFSAFLQGYLEHMKQLNPWATAAEFSIPMSTKEEMYVRGGILSNFTTLVDHYKPEIPWWNCHSIHEKSFFSEYILISNGNSGSTANTFQTTVEQIWKHRRSSGAKRRLTTLSYGGTTPEDTPLTQFAGGSVNDRVNVEDPFVGLAGLRVLKILFFDNEKHKSAVEKAILLLQNSLPEVPYCFQQFSKMPVLEIYNKFMLPGAMPLEFVNMPPDAYIPQIFVGKVFEDPRGLEELYQEAIQHFKS